MTRPAFPSRFFRHVGQALPRRHLRSLLLYGATLILPLLSVATTGLSAGHATGPDTDVTLQEVERAAPDPEQARPYIDLNSLLVNLYIARPTGQRADPINLIFLGTNDVPVIARLISDTVGWREGDGGTMFFAQYGQLSPHDKQLTSAVENGQRYHVRLEAGIGTIDNRPFVLGAVHMDFTTSCGHVGREFNGARNFLMQELLRRGFDIQIEYWGNTEPARHCDGSETMSDGFVALITVSN